MEAQKVLSAIFEEATRNGTTVDGRQQDSTRDLRPIGRNAQSPGGAGRRVGTQPVLLDVPSYRYRLQAFPDTAFPAPARLS